MKKEKDTLHVIICIHPMLNLYIEELISSINSTNYIIIEIYKNKLLKERRNLIRFNYNNIIEYIKCIRQAKQKIKNLACQYDNIHFYIPHPLHLITNYIAFTIVKNYKYKISLIPDGILNYYRCSAWKNFYKKMLLSKIFSIIFNIKYKIFNDHCTAINIIKYDSIYVLHEDDLVTKNPNIKINILEIKSKKKRKLKKNKAMIIGQPSNDVKAKKKLLEKQIEVAKKLTNIIVYKPHPSEYIEKSIKDLLDNYNIEIISDSTPVEEYIYKFDIYISTISSALMNLKILDKNIKCIAVLDDLNLIKKCNKNISMKDLEKLKKLFIELGVEVYD